MKTFFGEEDLDFALYEVSALLQRSAKAPVDVVHLIQFNLISVELNISNYNLIGEYLFDDAGAVLLQLLRVLFDDGERVGESGYSTAHLVVDTRDFTP